MWVVRGRRGWVRSLAFKRRIGVILKEGKVAVGRLTRAVRGRAKGGVSHRGLARHLKESGFRRRSVELVTSVLNYPFRLDVVSKRVTRDTIKHVEGRRMG